MKPSTYLVSPEVAGELGPLTELDTTVHPPIVSRLHYVFAGWNGSDIVESFPCFMVSDRLADALLGSNLTGFELDEATISKDEQFERFFTERAAALPNWRWLRVADSEDRGDFWQDANARLHVSNEAMRLLQTFDLSGAEYTEE